VRSLAAGSRYAAGLAVSDRLLNRLPAGWAVARPGRLVLGFGCSTDAEPADAVQVARTALHEAGLSTAGVRQLATIDRRRAHPATLAVAEALGARVVAFSPAELDAVPVPNDSERVRRAVGTASVAEAAALLVGGGRLLLEKRKGGAAAPGSPGRGPRGGIPPSEQRGSVTVAVAEVRR